MALANKGIKGITIEIGADTQPLEKALKSVNDKSMGLQSELKAVQKLLKMDGGNTVLLAQQQELLAESVEAAKEKLDALKAAQSQVEQQFRDGVIGEQQYRAFQREVADTEISLHSLEGRLESANTALSQNREEAGDATNALDTLGDATNNSTDGLGNLGDAANGITGRLQGLIDGLGGAGISSELLTGAMTKLAAGFAVAEVVKQFGEALAECIKMSDELQQSLNTLQTKTGAADKEMKAMEQSLKNIYSNNYGESFEDIAQSLAEVSSQTGLTGKALEGTTESAIALRDTFEYEVNESVRAVDMMMKQFGVTSEQAYSMIAQGAQKGLDKNGNLLDSINEYSVHFKQLGFDSEEMFNMFANGAQTGVFDIDKLGDAMKEFGIRVKDGSSTTVEAYAALGLNADELQQKFSDGGEEAQAAFQEVVGALNSCEDEVIKNAAGVNIFGSMWEDMGSEAVKALTDTNGEITKTTDSLEQIKEIKYDSLGEAFTGIKRQLEMGIMIPIGEEILPILNELADWISANMPAIETTIKGVLIAITGPIGMAVTTINALKDAGIGLSDELNGSVSPALDLFQEKVSVATDGTKTLQASISESTQEAVGAYLELEQGAEESLSKISSITTVTTQEQADTLEEYSNTVKEKYSAMKDMVCSKLDEQHAEEKAMLLRSFQEGTTLTAEQQAAAISSLNENYYQQKESIGTAYGEINAIVANAEAEKRGLSTAEMEKIHAIQQQQKTNAVNTLSETEMEAKVILERMKSYNETITTEVAAKTIQDAEAARQAVVAEAEQKCNDEIALATRMKDELGVISQEEYDKMVADAQRKRTDTVKEAEAMKEATVQAMLEQNEGLASAVDTGTGEILSKWEVFKNSTIAIWNNIGASLSQAINTIKTNVVQGVEELKTSVVKKFTDLREDIITKFNSILISISTFGEQFKKAGKDLIQGLIDGITSKMKEAVTRVKEVCGNIIQAAKSALDEHSPSKVFYAIGEYVSQGLADGISENGSEAVGVMQDLAGKIISTGDALSTGILSQNEETGELIYNELYKNTMDKIDLYYQDRDKRVSLMEEGTEENIKSVQREVKETEAATNLKIKMYQQECKARMQLIDNETDGVLDGLQSELDAIDKQEEKKQKAQEEEDYRQKMRELRSKLAIADEKDKEGIFAELEKTQADRQKVLDKQALNDKKEGIRQQMEEARKEAAQKKKQLQEELAEKEYQLTQQRAAEVEHMSTIIAFMQEQVKQKKELEKIQTDIAKKEEEIRSANLEESKRQETEIALKNLKIQKSALLQQMEDSKAFLRQKVNSAIQSEKDITQNLQEQTNQRNAILSGEAVTSETPVEITQEQREQQNTLAAEQTVFKKVQWDDQTAYQKQKEQEQTKTADQENKIQLNNFTTNMKRCETEFQLALNRMKASFRDFSVDLKSVSSQWGDYFYDGFTSTEDDIVAYINRMVREMKEALEDVSYISSGDFDRDIDGSHRNGLSYVPFDNYNAILHKGEAVLTAAENKAYHSGSLGNSKTVHYNVTQNIYSPTPSPRQEQKKAMRELKRLGLGV